MTTHTPVPTPADIAKTLLATRKRENSSDSRALALLAPPTLTPKQRKKAIDQRARSFLALFPQVKTDDPHLAGIYAGLVVDYGFDAQKLRNYITQNESPHLVPAQTLSKRLRAIGREAVRIHRGQ